MHVVVVVGLLLCLSACADNLPTNQTDEQPVAGRAALSAEPLDLPTCVSHPALRQSQEAAGLAIFGRIPGQCIDETSHGFPGQWTCYDTTAHIHKFLLFRNWAVIPTKENDRIELVGFSGPSVFWRTQNCTCISCTFTY